MSPENGDTVNIITKDGSYFGILMPRPEILDDNFVILKLDNGYNIGIEKKKIQKTELVKKYQKKREEKQKLKHGKGLPTVPIISFGGTISSRIDYRTGGVSADYTAEDFVAMMPELQEIANIKAEKAMSMMSEDATPDIWSQMARRIAMDLNDKGVAGVVATHGTDTMHYSTAMMSFYLRNINKPVIFTGSQRSIDRGSSDAFMNLVCSVNAAAKFDGAGVFLCMHGTTNDDYCLLIRGAKVRKMHTSRRDAFRPIGEKPVAKVFPDGRIEILNHEYRKRNDEKTAVDDVFELKTGLVYVYPFMHPDTFDGFIGKKYRGLVVGATALGHVPSNAIPKLKQLIDNGTMVVIASQTVYGRVHPYVYTNLRKLSIGLGCIFVDDMLPEVAYVKLGWVLGHTDKMEEARKMMLTNYAGEMTKRSDADSFLY